MSRRARYGWSLSSGRAARRRAAKRRSVIGSFAFSRRLRIEPLEDRRLLATITVNTLIDVNANDGLTTLREAIAAAALFGQTTIDFSVTGTINLSSLGQLNIDRSITINGPGANLLTIKAFDGGGSRVVNIVDDFGFINPVVLISGLTLTGGKTSGPGGAIFASEDLTVADCIITGNSAGAGAGGQGGGGIYSNAGSLIVERSTISHNTANSIYGVGGGIYFHSAQGGIVQIRDSTISGNLAGNAGGMYLVSSATTSTISNSTISGNTATYDGGGIEGTNVMVKNTTITQNSALRSHLPGPGGPPPIGGGFLGSGIFDHTIAAGNTAALGNDVLGSGPIVARFSLIGNGSFAGITDNGGNLIGTSVSPINALLGSLADNGGPTMTHALLPGSPAIHTGELGFSPPPDNDQRGAPFLRVVGPRIDIGAFEVQALPPPALPGDYNQNGVVDTADYVLWRNTLTNNVAPFSGADGDGDGMIDQDDYGVWRAHFGQTLPVPAAGSVADGEDPHPSPLPEGEGIDRQPPALPGVRVAARDPQASSFVAVDAQINSPAKPGVVERSTVARLGENRELARWRDDALLVWLASQETDRRCDAVEVSAIGRNEDVDGAADRAFDALDVAFGALEDQVSR